MLCSKCQTVIPDGTMVCQKCGEILNAPKPPEAPKAPQPTNTPQESLPTPTVIYHQKSVKEFSLPKLPKIFWILFAVAAGIIILGLIIGYLANLSRQNKAVSTSGSQSAPSAAISPALTSGFFSFTESSVTQAPNTKYDIDSDGDAIPDFVETAIGFDPNYNNAFNCVKEVCEAPGQQTTQTSQTNILFILDASGSMAESISGGVKMDLAKQALKKYAEAVPTDTAVGLMVYGHKGSSSAKDKALSCTGIETVYPIGLMDKSLFESSFVKFSPTGWTAIGWSLRKATEAFIGREGQNNLVIVISDGIETCDSDPVGATRELKSLLINPQIDVIGLAVDAATRAQLQEVARIGGGTYKPANSGVELEDALKKTIEAARQYLICSFKTSTAYQNCLILKQYKPAATYLQNLQTVALKANDLEEEAASRRAQSTLLDYWGDLYSQNSEVSSKANQELYRQYEELRKQKK